MRLARMAALALTLVMAGTIRGFAQPPPEAVQKCQQNLSQRLGLPLETIRISRMRQVLFPDVSLGLPRPGENPTRARISGRILLLEAGRESYLYTASESRFRYGGPLRSWKYSALAIHPVPGDPDQNGDLVQTSLVGTNPSVRLRRVRDFRPQTDGSLLAWRRLSRSSQELLYLPPGNTKKEHRLLTAFDLAAGTLDSAKSRWACFMRSGPSVSWALACNRLDAEADQTRLVQLPAQARPVRVFWEEANPVIEVTVSGGTRHFELAREGETENWRELATYPDPLTRDLQINKNQRLLVRASPQGRSTLVLEAWSSGDERVLANISAFEAHQVSLSAGKEFLVLSGRRGDESRAFTVDLKTCEVMFLGRDFQGEARIFRQPVGDWSRLEKWLRLKS
ncbi:MAG: hypothetical protein ACOX9B_08685 [Candidatus Xenobium sp.]|jgi:hypothetical protein|nr:hypothetical protein [Burkholderiales bacterium]